MADEDDVVRRPKRIGEVVVPKKSMLPNGPAYSPPMAGMLSTMSLLYAPGYAPTQTLTPAWKSNLPHEKPAPMAADELHMRYGSTVTHNYGSMWNGKIAKVNLGNNMTKTDAFSFYPAWSALVHTPAAVPNAANLLRERDRLEASGLGLDWAYMAWFLELDALLANAGSWVASMLGEKKMEHVASVRSSEGRMLSWWFFDAPVLAAP